MRIVIVGAGAIGSFLAERLSLERQDVVLIESNPEVAAKASDEIDCLVITGNGASSDTLKEAGIAKADLLIAVSSSDAVNVLACAAATKLKVPNKVARVEDPKLKAEVEALGVDLVIDPDAAAARELVTLAAGGEVAERVEFGSGDLVLIGGYVAEDSDIIGGTLAELRETVVGWDWLVLAVIHGKHTGKNTVIARGDTTLEAGDHVLMMAKKKHAEKAYGWLGISSRPAETAFIIGGTRMARLAADALVARGVRTTLAEGDPSRAQRIAERHPHVTVINAAPSERDVLEQEGIGNADTVMAVTGWDGENVLAALIAKTLGAREVISRFTNIQLMGLGAGVGIDATVSPRLSAANEILRFVRRGAIHSVETFSDTDAEAIELEVGPNSYAIGKTLMELELPRTLIVGGVERDGRGFVPTGDTRIEVGDHLIVVSLPDSLAFAEKLSG